MEHLIPDSDFAPLAMFTLIAIGVGGLYILSVTADVLVESATDLALRLGLPKVIIGATILSLGTTAPECAVSVLGAIDGDGGLALGNAVGSVIFDTAVIFGLLGLFAPLPADRFILARQGWVQFGSAVLLAAACYLFYARDGLAASLPGWFGWLLLGLLAAYLVISVRWAKQHKALAAERSAPPDATQDHHPEEVSDEIDEHGSDRPVWIILAIMVAALAGMLIAGRFVVGTAVEAATRLAIPEQVISATFVALGTSLPELVVGLKAIRRGAGEILVGNVVGADILNVLFVAGASAVGAAAAGQPLEIVSPEAARPTVFLEVQLPMMLLSLLYFRVCIAKASKTGRFDQWMGIPLLAIYAIGTAASFLLS